VTLFWIIVCASLGTQITGPRLAGCGPELGPESSLLYELGISPTELSPLSDLELLHAIEAAPNAPGSRRFATSRALLWEPVLKFRTVPGAEGVEIPLDSGRWRVGRVTHPWTGRRYEVVHWADIDDSSYTLYFARGSAALCQVVFEN